jgi:site-specific DNA-cytosine methylase
VSQQLLLPRRRHSGPVDAARSGLRVVSLFSGAGGLDLLGVERAGYAVVFAVENDPMAVATLNRNRPRFFPAMEEVTPLDITTLDPQRVLAKVVREAG